MRLNIHISFWSSSSGLKEDEWLNISLVKWNCSLSKLICFLSITFFNKGFIVWFVWAFSKWWLVFSFPLPLFHPFPCPSQPSPWGSERLDMQPNFYQISWFLANFLSILNKIMWTFFLWCFWSRWWFIIFWISLKYFTNFEWKLVYRQPRDSFLKVYICRIWIREGWTFRKSTEKFWLCYLGYS